MSRSRARSGIPSKQKVPRMRPAAAAAVLEQCRKTLDDCRDLLRNLRQAGLGQLLTKLDDKVLQLAIQPDSWGERTRARLMSDIAPALGLNPERESVVSIEEVVQVANIVMPCLLLEIGRRKQHIQVDFPPNPLDGNSRFTFRVGPAHSVHSITNEQLLTLVTVAGEALVGLCYFGDPECRARVEADLSLMRVSRPRACRTPRPPEPQH